MNRFFLITGADSDVGLAFIERVYKKGDTIIAQAFGNENRLNVLKEKLQANIAIYHVDLTSVEDCKTFVEEIKPFCGELTHFVHLPALPVINTKFSKFDEERFALDINVQLYSAIIICKEFVPLMAKRKYGRVLFMLTSYLMSTPPKNVAAYTMAKSALGALAKSLAIDYAAHGITVNCVMPSMMETKFLEDTPSLIVQASAAENPMKRNATVHDVVPAMEFLISDEASFITGVTLPITGGSSML